MRKIKWGVLGYARIARNEFIPALQRIVNAELWAVASRDPEKQKECRETLPCPRVYDSYETLLQDPEVEAVYIPLPNSLHKEWSIRAAKAGKHVLCEKPMALDFSECREMIEAARANGVRLMEAFMYRYTDRTRKLREILASGIIGPVKYINASFRFHLTRENTIKGRPELGGGSLYDVGCYPVNLIGMVNPGLPEAYTAECVTENGVDVIFSGVLRYPNGVIATVHCGFNAYDRIHAEIIGTQGVIEVPETFLGTAGEIRVIKADGTQTIPVLASDRYGLEVADFSQAIIDGRPPLLDLEESLRNMQVIEELLKAAGLRKK